MWTRLARCFALTHKKSVMEANLLLDKLGETPLLG